MKPAQQSQKTIVTMAIKGKTALQIHKHLKKTTGGNHSILAIGCVLWKVHETRVAKGLPGLQAIEKLLPAT